MDTSVNLPSSALQFLRRADIRIASGGPADLMLVLPDGRVRTVRVKVHRRPPSPSSLRSIRLRHPEEQVLVVTTHITQHLEHLAHEGAIDVVGVDSETAIIDGTAFVPPRSVDSRPQPERMRGRKPWIRWATERLLLLTDEPLPQKYLADALATSQQSISHSLRAHPYASRAADGWFIETTSEHLDQHLNEYPGPGGASTYWFGLDPAVRQALDARNFALEIDVHALVSGDVAADTYSPWRLPTSAAVYTEEILDFTSAGFTPAASGEHTLQVIAPEDPTIWRTGAFIAAATLVDPIIALQDIRRSPGPDSGEAAEQLRKAIIEGSWRG